MGGGASRSKASASGAVPHKSAPASAVTSPKIAAKIAALELDARPATVNENWRVTPREREPEEKPPPSPEVESTADSNAKRSVDSNHSAGAASPRPASVGQSPLSEGLEPSAVEAPTIEAHGYPAVETPPVDPLLRSPREPAQVLELVQNTFGQMVATSMSSPKWDRRAEALKGVEQMVRAARLAGGTTSEQQRQIIVAARILEQALREKVWPVLSAAFGLYKVVLDHSVNLSEQDRDAGIKALLPVIATRLGEVNAKIHESAAGAFLSTAAVSADAPRLCVNVLVTSLQSDAKADNKAVTARLAGGLACLHRLVRELGCDAAMDTAAPVLQMALDHKSDKVRQLGLDVVADLTRNGADLGLTLRPALEDALQARLSELEENDGGDGECFDAPDFAVVGIKAPISREAEVAKPALDFEDDEEALMDNILGDTGLAFQNTLTKSELNVTQKTQMTEMTDVDALEAEFLRDLEGLSTSP